MLEDFSATAAVCLRADVVDGDAGTDNCCRSLDQAKQVVIRAVQRALDTRPANTRAAPAASRR